MSSTDLWRFHGPDVLPTYDDLEAIGKHLLLSFGEKMGSELQLVLEQLVLHEAVVLGVRGTKAPAACGIPFESYWEGKILYHVSTDMPHVLAELLIFTDGKRVGLLTHRGASKYLISGSPSVGGGVSWSQGRWMHDDYSEYDAITEPRWIELEEVVRTRD